VGDVTGPSIVFAAGSSGSVDLGVTVTTSAGCSNNCIASVPIRIYNAALDLEKTANFGPSPSNPANMSDTISYNITVANAGDVTLYKVNVTDDKLGLNKQIDALAPGASQFFYLSYLVSESDLCKDIDNEARANATDPCGKVLADVFDRWSVPTTYKAAIKIDKSADVSSAAIGDVINYTYNVTNTGNVNLSDLDIEDDKLGSIDTKGG
jgi:uncharacterized membrane protein